MVPRVWTYEDPEKQTVHYRGYVAVYEEDRVTTYACRHVRKSKLLALADAKSLQKRLKTKL